MSLGARIKYLRQQAGLSQEALAERMEVSRQAVAKWEADQSAPSTKKLFQLAEALDTTVDFMLDKPLQPSAVNSAKWKGRLKWAGLTALGYLAVFLLGRCLCTTADDLTVMGWLFGTDPRQTTYLFGWLLSSNFFLIASLISILPALLGARVFSLTTLGSFVVGLVAGELFGPYPAGEAYGHGHYGWFIWMVCFLIGVVAGIILELWMNHKSKK